MREGDLYRWAWKQQILEQRFEPYHCCAQLAEVKNGRLEDLYWHTSDNRSWSPEEAAEQLELTFLANREDLVESSPADYSYHHPDDIVDLRHRNNSDRGHVYRRKGAKRNLDVMIRTLLDAAERLQRERDRAMRSLERVREQLVQLETGAVDDLDKVYLTEERTR